MSILALMCRYCFLLHIDLIVLLSRIFSCSWSNFEVHWCWNVSFKRLDFGYLAFSSQLFVENYKVLREFLYSWLFDAFYSYYLWERFETLVQYYAMFKFWWLLLPLQLEACHDVLLIGCHPWSLRILYTLKWWKSASFVVTWLVHRWSYSNCRSS